MSITEYKILYLIYLFPRLLIGILITVKFLHYLFKNFMRDDCFFIKEHLRWTNSIDNMTYICSILNVFNNTDLSIEALHKYTFNYPEILEILYPYFDYQYKNNESGGILCY